MTRRRNLLTVLALIVLTSSFALADAKEDLAAGRAALTQGDLDKAHALLRAAAEAMPDSVEAQLALADCDLQMGKLDDAVAQFKTVLKLSPNHTRAKRMVDALAGHRGAFESKLAAAAELAAVKAHANAVELLRATLRDVLDPAQREQVRLLIGEYTLFSSSSPAALAEAVQLAGESQTPAVKAAAGTIAALAAAEMQQFDQAAQILKRAGNAAPKAWQDRHALVAALIGLSQGADPVATSATLGASLATIPDSPLRQRLTQRFAEAMIAAARQRLAKDERDAALAIIWPMFDGKPAPGDDAVLKEIKITVGAGWLGESAAAQPLWNAGIDVLVAIGAAQVDREDHRANLRAIWLAAEVSRQMPGDEAVRHDKTIQVIEQLAAMSRSAPDRKPGAAMSAADTMQRTLLLGLAPRLGRDDQRERVANAAIAHLVRYETAKDLPAGLQQFVTAEAPTTVTLSLTRSAAHRRLLGHLIALLVKQGKIEFDRAAASLDSKANEKLAPSHRAALSLAMQALAQYPGPGLGVAAPASTIASEYAQADRWDAALEAVTIFPGSTDPAQKQWAILALQLRRVLADETKQLAAGRKLPAELDARIKAALTTATSILQAAPIEANRQRVTESGDALVAHYVKLHRFDLAESVIAGLSALPAGGKVDRQADLRDWASWARAAVASRQAADAIALVVREGDPAKLALVDQHKNALALYGQIVTTFSDSTFAAPAIEQVIRIAASYENFRAFDVAAAVLADFIKAHPGIKAAERLELQLALVSLHKAERLFADGIEKLPPLAPPVTPTKLSDEFTVAINALSAFIKAHPVGPLTSQAEAHMLSVVRLYGSIDAWPVAREALALLIAAGPPLNERRSPGYYRLLEAATYLGELDRAYGLSLLNPAIHPRFDEGEVTAVALAAGEPGKDSGLGDGLLDKLALDASKYAEFDFAARSGKVDAGGVGGGRIPVVTATPGPTTPAAGQPAPPPVTRQPVNESDTALAMIRQSEQQHLASIARLQGNRENPKPADPAAQQAQSVALPNGTVLSAAELARQDAASEKAYAILLELIRVADPAQRGMVERSRGHLFWMFSFFESQMRADRALAMIQKYLTDRPTDPDRVTLAFRALNDRVAFASYTNASDRLTQAWADERHVRFDQARADIAAFIKAYADKTQWVNQARVLTFETYLRESELIAPVSPVLAAGLLVRGADELLMLLATVPAHPECGNFPNRMWNIADRLAALGQREQAIFILNRITIAFPTHELARQAVQRIAQTYAADLSSPLRAVETYQEFLSLNADTPEVREQIFNIASQLSTRRRYIEALHVYGVFVDSFPSDPKASAALQAIGAIHQVNEAWTEAVAAYERILVEYSAAPIVPQVKLAVAECHINLSQWLKARRIYEEYVVAYPSDPAQPGAGGIPRTRIEVLKNLDRYQKLLDDKAVDRNKDDAQFQIARIVLDQLGYTDKAIREFRKVVTNFATSHMADDAQLEIGMAMLRIGRLDEAREELLKVVTGYPNSPLADNALHLVGQSFEQQAQRLSGVTVQLAKAEAFDRGQRLAYAKQQVALEQQSRDLDDRRKELKKGGDARQLGIEEAYGNFRFNDANNSAISILNREAECTAETESAMEVANRQDRINEAFRQAVAMYAKAATDYPLGDKTSESLLRMAEIYETQLKDKANAMATYDKIVKVFPGTPVAEDAAWKVAQFLDEQTKYAQAVQAYRDFIRNYPASKRVADAQFALAESLEQLSRWVEAMDAYETFREKFAKHPKAAQALEQINWIKAYRK